jgi:hypothetical protein
MTDDKQQIWNDYYARIRKRRIAEAETVNSRLSADGVTADTVLALDFEHFGNSENDIRKLSEQLSENYSMTVLLADDGKTWFANGTTRPYGVDGMVGNQLQNWVTFMCDAASSYACVFSAWKLVDAKRKIEWSTHDLDAEPDADAT